jgi:hypothetical protein
VWKHDGRRAECFHTISSFPNFHECWYNCISIRKKVLYLFWQWVDIELYHLSQSPFRIYKCYIIIQNYTLQRKVHKNKILLLLTKYILYLIATSHAVAIKRLVSKVQCFARFTCLTLPSLYINFFSFPPLCKIIYSYFSISLILFSIGCFIACIYFGQVQYILI